MATSVSVQEPPPAVSGLASKENTLVLEQLAKEASSIVVANDGGGKPQEQVKTLAGFMNHTGKQLHLIQLQEWSGFWHEGGPKPVIEDNGSIGFSHIGTPDGSMAGAKYVAHELGHQWVVAWHVPLRTDKPVFNMVYFEDGPQGPVDWDKIKKQLENPISIPVLPNPPPAGAARIKQGSTALLAAFFTKPKTDQGHSEQYYVICVLVEGISNYFHDLIHA